MGYREDRNILLNAGFTEAEKNRIQYITQKSY